MASLAIPLDYPTEALPQERARQKPVQTYSQEFAESNLISPQANPFAFAQENAGEEKPIFRTMALRSGTETGDYVFKAISDLFADEDEQTPTEFAFRKSHSIVASSYAIFNSLLRVPAIVPIHQ